MALFLSVLRACSGYDYVLRSGDMMPGEKVEEVWKLTLDQIPKEVVGSIHLDMIEKEAMYPFIQRAVDILVKTEAHEKITLDLKIESMKERTLRTTRQQFEDHIDSLVESGILIEVTKDAKARACLVNSGRYFAVPKGREKARAILNAKPIKRLYRTPPSVNTCDPPRVVKLVSLLQGKKHRKMYYVCADWRHYFHQLKQCEDFQKVFGVALRSAPVKGRDSLLRYFIWKTVAMGWCWAPYIAQCLGWQFLCRDAANEGEVLGDRDRLLRVELPKDTEEPPSYIHATYGEQDEGLVFLYIDNVHAYFTSQEAAHAFHRRILRNASHYAVKIKEITLCDEAQIPSISEAEARERELQQETEDRQTRDEGTTDVPTKQPSPTKKKRFENPWKKLPCTLGLQYAEEVLEKNRCKPSKAKRKLCWRIEPAKVEDLPVAAVTEAKSPREMARICGKLLYWRLLHPIVPVGNGHLIRILSDIGKKQRTLGGWDASGYSLSEEDRVFLESGWQQLRSNPWIKETIPTKQFWLASDASEPGWGWVLFKDGVKDHSSCKGKFKPSIAGMHIYIKEILAAVWAIRYVLDSISEGEEGAEVVIAIDNVAARFAVERQASINHLAGEVLDSMSAELVKKGVTVTTIPILGHYNVADYPSRDMETPTGMVHKKDKSKKGLKEHFAPLDETWNVLQQGYQGLRQGADWIKMPDGIRHDEEGYLELVDEMRDLQFEEEETVPRKPFKKSALRTQRDRSCNRRTPHVFRKRERIDG